MAKRAVAVTRIKFGSGPESVIEAGADITAGTFNKDQLKELYDAGSIVLMDDTTVEEAAQEAATETPEVSSEPADEASETPES